MQRMNAMATLYLLKGRTITTAASIVLIVLMSGCDSKIRNESKRFNISHSGTDYQFVGKLLKESGLISKITSVDYFYQSVIKKQ
jgi:uncharacterized lipoprotein YehR (DUF1307 family)